MILLTELRRRNVVRVTAAYLVVGWLLTEVLTTILPTLGAPDWTARAVILVFALGFIPAVALTWIYQITPEGIKRDSDFQAERGATPGSKVFDYVVIASVVLLVFVLAIVGSQPEPVDEPTGLVSNASIAVLPFQDMSPEKDHEYFADGLTETLLHMLAQIPDLQVAARTSSFAFKGQNMDIRKIAKALQVAHVLEGSVQRNGDKLRVTAQLIRADDGFHMFSSTFDREIDDIFLIQDEIAGKVGKELSESILGASAPPDTTGAGTQNSDAYLLYLQAVSETSKRSFRGLQAAESLLKGALAIDPGYLDAKTELANNYLHQFETGLLKQSEAGPRIRAMLSQVLEARPDDAGATAIRHYLQANTPMTEGQSVELAAAISRFEALVAANPANYRIRALLGRVLRAARMYDKALATQLDALKRDPFNAEIYFELGSLYVEQGNLEEARSALGKSLEFEPGQPNAYVRLADLSRQQGDATDYVRQLLKAMSVDAEDHEIPGFLASFLYQLGLIEEGDDFRNRVLAIAPTSESAYQIDRLRAMAIDDQATAIASARRALEDNVGNRQFAFAGAVQYLLRTAAMEGRIEEELAYIEAVAPGIWDLDAPSLSSKYRASQIVALDAWFVTLTQEELARRIDLLRSVGMGMSSNPFDDPANEVSWLAMLGQTEEAIVKGLASTFSESVLLNLAWQESSALPQYRELVMDSRIQAAIQKWEAEFVVERERVREYLAQLDADQ